VSVAPAAHHVMGGINIDHHGATSVPGLFAAGEVVGGLHVMEKLSGAISRRPFEDEERVHAGEFLRLLRELAPDEEKFYAEGAEEVEELIEKLKNNVSIFLRFRTCKL
jgi:succinate dehydrogenase/fumarate reductase flavoprotein subunit